MPFRFAVLLKFLVLVFLWVPYAAADPVVLPNGDTYDGETEDGERHGEGIYQ